MFRNFEIFPSQHLMDFPVSRLEAGMEIRQLVVERGINNLTSRIIRAHLESKFGLSFEDHKAEVDKITAEQIHEVQSDKKPIKNETSDDKVDIYYKYLVFNLTALMGSLKI